MTKFSLLFFFCFFLISNLSAQVVADSLSIKTDTETLRKKTVVKDTSVKATKLMRDSSRVKEDSTTYVKTDSLSRNNKNFAVLPDMSLFRHTLLQNPWFNFFGKMQVQEIQVHEAGSTDGLFYLLTGLCFYFVLIRFFFNKYLNNVLSLFFRASIRQQQIREQALQTPLPSLLLNIQFVFTSGLYACFVMRYYQFAEQTDFWLLYFYCLLTMAAIYLARFCILKLIGWIFNITKTCDNYIFIIFLVNKILGIALLPFLMIISFSGSVTQDVAITISMVMIAVLFIYRFVACYGTIRSEIKLSIFHYFIYLCAFEIAPLLLIYKVVLSYLKKAY